MQRGTYDLGYGGQHGAGSESIPSTFNTSCIDPFLLGQDARMVRSSPLVTQGLQRENKPRDLAILSNSQKHSKISSGTEDEDPAMYRTPPLPYFTRSSRQPASVTATQTAAQASTTYNGQRPPANSGVHSSHQAGRENALLTVRKERSPIRYREGPPNKQRRNSGGLYNNWRIVHREDPRIGDYVRRWGKNRSPSIRRHNRPGCACNLDAGFIRRFDRGVICGIHSPAINRDLMAAEVARSKQIHTPRSHKSAQEFYCPICGQGLTQWQSVKTHFPFCANKYGNPNGHSWYDHPSMCITSRAK